MNTKDELAIFDYKVDKGIFLGFFYTSKAHTVFNTRTLVVEGSIHVKFNNGLTLDKKLSDLVNDSGQISSPLHVVIYMRILQIEERFHQTV